MSLLNQIQRSTFIRAPRSRVWRALTDIGEFCKWFSAESDDAAFRPGVRNVLRSTYPGPHYKRQFYVEIEEMIPEERFSWRWHPGAKEPTVDLTAEPMTLVTFTLKDVEGGTDITVTETGFDQLFEARRAPVSEQNEGGWKYQMSSLERYFGEGA